MVSVPLQKKVKGEKVRGGIFKVSPWAAACPGLPSPLPSRPEGLMLWVPKERGVGAESGHMVRIARRVVPSLIDRALRACCVRWAQGKDGTMGKTVRFPGTYIPGDGSVELGFRSLFCHLTSGVTSGRFLSLSVPVFCFGTYFIGGRDCLQVDMLGCELLTNWYVGLNPMKLPIVDRSVLQIGSFTGFNLVRKVFPLCVVLCVLAAIIICIIKNFNKLTR